MKFRLLIASLALPLLAACSPSGDDTTAPVTSSASPALLSHAPADSFMLIGNLEPLPEELSRYYLQRSEPLIQAYFDASRASMDELADSDELEGEDEETLRDGVDLAQAVLAELDGKINPEGLESLGLDLSAHAAFYFDQLSPVFRMTIGDRDRLTAALDRIAARVNRQIGGSELEGFRYWQFEHDQVTAYLGISDEQFVATVLPVGNADARLATLFAAEGRHGTAAADRLREANESHGYLPYGTVLFDLHAAMDAVLENDSTEANALLTALDFDPASLEPACVNDVRRLTADLGLMSSGYSQLDRQGMRQRSVLSLNDGLAQTLQSLANALPPLERVDNALASARFGINLVAMREWLREALPVFEQQPLTCSALTDVNRQIEEARVALNRPLPPFIGNWRGLRFSMASGAEGTGGDLFSNRGLMALHMDNPQMLIGMAQLFVPELAEIRLQRDGTPVRLPDQLTAPQENVSLPPSWAAMTDEVLALAIGEAYEPALSDFLQAEAENDGTILEFEYDMQAYTDMIAGAVEYTARQTAEENNEAIEDEAAGHYADALEASGAIFGQVGTLIRFSDEGIVMEQSTTLR